MARIQIYVTEDLKKRMQTEPDVNWSKVAQKAFIREIENANKIHIRSLQKGLSQRR